MADMGINLRLSGGAGGGGGGGSDLAATLAAGPDTGGNDIVITNGDEIIGIDTAAASNSNGGDIIIRAGNKAYGGLGTAAGRGGNLTVRAGDYSGGSVAVPGGSLTIRGGDSDSGDGGGLTIRAGHSTSAGVTPPTLLILGGDTNGVGGGPVIIRGGTLASGSNTTGYVDIVGGAPGSGNSDGAPVNLRSAEGNYGNNSNTGAVYIYSGGAGAISGDVYISGGTGNRSGVFTGVYGGAVRITGGATLFSGSSGADVVITSGGGHARSGHIELTCPAGGSGAANTGDIKFASRNSGTITFNDSSNVNFTGPATGATSITGAINRLGSAGATGTEFGWSTTDMTKNVPAGILAADGDAIEVDCYGTAGDQFTVKFAGTTLVSTGGAASENHCRMTIVRISSGNIVASGLLLSGFGTDPSGGAFLATAAADSGDLYIDTGAGGTARGILWRKLPNG